MPNKKLSEDEGGHKYPPEVDGKDDHCLFNCGCSSTIAFGSDGPKGIDPLGTCPNNPITIKNIGNKKEPDKNKPDGSLQNY